MTENVISNLIANAIGWAILYLANRLRLWLFTNFGRRDPRRWQLVVILLIITWGALNIGIYYLPFISNFSAHLKISVPLFTSLIVFVFLWRDLNQFRAVGIYGADEKIKSGIDYKASLKLCQNSLSFLGIGASKLTEIIEFEQALERCSDDNPVRFLLFEPTNEKLTEAAMRANRPVEEYRNIVLKSLQTIAQLKRNRNFNIEVRFYQATPIFRLMLIDDSLCLLSYNIFGKGDGSDFPQLHLIKSIGAQKEKSFYHPLNLYFEQQWNEGIAWNFQDYLPKTS
ncbi:MAG: hypothetical protein A2511_10465 [Deltaproteobacteria bacterium RIFOXYD12_FULL_50_9]|nr:MAG: hypothetical protein A2511_10465 [Deltaproteobacteria bacterium RIFOXYD12_FULL_50_9]